MRVVLALLFLLALCACTPSVPAQSDLGTALDDYLTNQIGGGFSGAVLVAVDGEVVLRKGYGLATALSTWIIGGNHPQLAGFFLFWQSNGAMINPDGIDNPTCCPIQNLRKLKR